MNIRFIKQNGATLWAIFVVLFVTWHWASV
jgi:hypothetical protein